VKQDAIESDLKRVDALRDEDIDYSDIPELDADFFRKARVVVPPRKQQLTIRVDTDVLAWLKRQGKGYQTRINAILRAYYDAHRDEARTPGPGDRPRG
jgi:uncharacterized protein (DUF4415 family)